MAAIFLTPSEGSSFFFGGFSINTSVRVPFLNGLVGPDGFSIISDVSVQNADTIQFFQTFDDFVSYFYFGKGLGMITINGIIFSQCNDLMPGIDIFYDKIARFRGKPVDISFGSAVFTGVISNFSTVAKADPDNTVDFSIAMTIIDHSLPSAQIKPLC